MGVPGVSVRTPQSGRVGLGGRYSRCTLAPKSTSAFSTLVPPIFTEMVRQLGSWYFTGVLHWMITLTCSVRKAFLSTFNPLFIVHRSFKNLAYVGTCLIMSRRGVLTFTCLSTSNISAWLMAFFLAFSTCGKGGGVLFFTAFSLITSSSGSGSFTSWPSFVGLGTGCLTSLPLLIVITSLTSSILGFCSLEELNSCTPMRLGYVWEGNFPFSCTCSWLVNLEIEHCRCQTFEPFRFEAHPLCC